MKVAPIGISPSKNRNLNTNHSDFMQIPSFKADRFDGFSILDSTLTELKNVVDKNLVPYIDEYKDRYTAVGYMGIELQKVLDEIQKQNNEFFRNEIIGESKSEIFDTVKNEIGDYEQYLKNVREFEHLSEMGKNSIYETPQIKQKIEGMQPIYRSDSIFANKKGLYQVYKNCTQNLEDNTLNINLKNSEPGMYNEIKIVKDLYNTAIAVILGFPVNEAMRIKSETEALLKSNEKAYIRLDKAERLLDKVYSGSLLKCIQKSKDNEPEINKFLEENKNYKAKLPSVSEIKEAYKHLQEKKNNELKKVEGVLSAYYNHSYKKVYNNTDIEALLSAQKTANQELWSMIDEAKTEYISRQNELTMQHYDLDLDT